MRISFFLLLFFSKNLFSQNLVPNESFEQHHGAIPCKMILKPEEFSRFLTDWTVPSNGTTDIFSILADPTCYANPYGDTTFDLKKPRWGIGQKAPRTGNMMIGFYTYAPTSPNYREYAQVRLKQTLKKGEKYYVECWIARANFTHFATNHVGIAFSEKPIRTHHARTLNLKPVLDTSEIVRTRTDVWYQLADTISLETDANYLIIGNFFTDKETEILEILSNLDSSDPNRNGAFYYIDDVGVWKVQPIYNTRTSEEKE